MTSPHAQPKHRVIVEYEAIGAVDLATLNTAVQAKIALGTGWEPWGSVAVTTGAGDTHHQGMVRYGPERGWPRV
jgi:hypothetical protein